MEEYVAKSVELSRFSPYLILDESKKVKKFWEGLNDRIHPLIIASRVDTFTEAVKRAMSLEKDFKYSLISKESERSKGLLILNMVRVKGIRKDSLKTRVIKDNLLGIARVPILSLVIRSGLAFVVVKPLRVKLAWRE